jgi:hypothetical protein
VVIGKVVATHSCLTLIVHELRISVEEGMMVITLDRIKHSTPFFLSIHK